MHLFVNRPSACVRKSVFGACRGFAAGYVTKALLNGIVTAIAKRSPSKFFTAFRSNDPMRFGLFLGALAGVNGAMRCLLSHARGVDDRLNAAIAGLELRTPFFCFGLFAVVCGLHTCTSGILQPMLASTCCCIDSRDPYP